MSEAEGALSAPGLITCLANFKRHLLNFEILLIKGPPVQLMSLSLSECKEQKCQPEKKGRVLLRWEKQMKIIKLEPVTQGAVGAVGYRGSSHDTRAKQT